MPPSRAPSDLATLIRRGAAREATQAALSGGNPTIEPGAQTPPDTMATHLADADPHTGYVKESEFAAKGDLLAGLAAGLLDNLPVGADGQVLTADSAQTLGLKWATPAAGGGGGGAMSKIAEVVLAADTASIDFASIPTTFEELRLVLVSRIDTAATSEDVAMRFNGDTAANYDALHHVDADYRDTGATYINVGTFAAASAPADVADMAVIDIPKYARTVFQKTARSVSGTKQGTSATYASHATGWWRSTAAINQVTLLPVTAGKKFKAGTVATLYGIGGTGGGGGGGARTLAEDLCNDASLPSGWTSSGQLTFDGTKLRRELGGTSASDLTTPALTLQGPLSCEVYIERLSTVAAGNIVLELLNGSGVVVSQIALQADANVVVYQGDQTGVVTNASGDQQYRHWELNLDVESDGKHVNATVGWAQGGHLYGQYTATGTFAQGDSMKFRLRTTSTGKVAVYEFRVGRGVRH